MQTTAAQQKQKKAKNNSGMELNSQLIRRPIQRCFALFLLPTFICFCIGFLWPFIQGIYLSFCKFSTTSNAEFIGLANFVEAFNDAQFRYSFGYTALFAIASIITINLIAFAIAYALTRAIKGTTLFRGVFFLPNLIGGIVLGYIWQVIFSGVLSPMGLSIKTSTTLGFWGLVILMNWQQVGYMMIIYIAGIQAVPADELEAAGIDGANGWQKLIHITLPTVMPSITICNFLTLTNSFKLFDQNMVLNGGAPLSISVANGAISKINTTEMMALNIYNTFYTNANYRGVGQAKAVLFFLLVSAIALGQMWLTRSREVQQ